MKRSWWRTGPPLAHTQPVPVLTAGQLLRQIVLLLLVAALWGGAFLVLLGATRSSNVAFVAERGTPEKIATATVAVVGTPTMTPTNVVAASAAATSAAATSTASSASPTPSASSAATQSAATATATLAASTPTPKAITATPASTSGVTTSISFQRDVLPIFTQVCVKCHGGEKTQKSLVLKTYDDMMQGSEDGPVVEPGDSRSSLLVDMIVKGKMPKNGPKLLPRQIQTIIAWIDAGAPNN